MSSLVSAEVAARYAKHAAIRTSNGNFIHQIYLSAGRTSGQTNCGLKNGRSYRSLVNLTEVHVDRLCAKCWNVASMAAQS